MRWLVRLHNGVQRQEDGFRVRSYWHLSCSIRGQPLLQTPAPAFEATYGTLPVNGFTKMPFANTSPGAEQLLITSELLN